MTTEQTTNGTTAHHAQPQSDPARRATVGWQIKLRDLTRTGLKQLVSLTKTHPYIALGIAGTAGFVLGGGLSSRSGRFILLGAVEYAVRELTSVAGT